MSNLSKQIRNHACTCAFALKDIAGQFSFFFFSASKVRNAKVNVMLQL